MTPEQITKALDRYIVWFKAHNHVPLRAPANFTDPPARVAASHAHWMCIETKKFVAEKPAKAMRWLCFIQGAMWSHCGWSIDEFKNDNRGED